MARINRGEIWVVNLEPGFYKEIHKKRPALVISENAVNQNTPVVIIVPISSQTSKVVGPEMIVVGKREGLGKRSVILPLFLRSIDQERLVKRVGKISKLKLQEVEQALKIVLSLTKD